MIRRRLFATLAVPLGIVAWIGLAAIYAGFFGLVTASRTIARLRGRSPGD